MMIIKDYSNFILEGQVEDIISEIESLSHMFLDEGYNVIIKRDQGTKKNVIVIYIDDKDVKEIPEIIKPIDLSKNEYYQEYIDRLKGICESFNYEFRYARTATIRRAQDTVENLIFLVPKENIEPSKFDKQGHLGTSGLYPPHFI